MAQSKLEPGVRSKPEGGSAVEEAALLGLGRFPSDDNIHNFFLRFPQARVQAFWRPLCKWLLLLLRCPAAGAALDLDSTLFCREGQQEGARKGFHPRRKGLYRHHPMRAVLAEVPFVLHGWLRNDNTDAARGVVGLPQEALSLLPEETWVCTVRADSGFFDGAPEFTTMASRQAVTPTPYAIRAANAGSVSGTIPDAQLSAPIAASPTSIQ